MGTTTQNVNDPTPTLHIPHYPFYTIFNRYAIIESVVL